MKKLNFKELKLEADDILQRSQLKTIFGGGYGGPTCTCYDSGGTTRTKTFSSPSNCSGFCATWCGHNVPHNCT